jgi:hypothetical protein
VESRPGRGTRISATIPLSPVEPRLGATAGVRPPGARS